MNFETMTPTPALPQTTVKTVNGKLIVHEEVGVEGIKTRIGELSQSFEQLGRQTISLQHQHKQESLQHLRTMQSSLQTVEKLYRRLFATTLVTGMVLTVMLLWTNSRRSECAVHSLESTAPVEITHS